MKSKREFMLAKLPLNYSDNAKNLNGEKQLLQSYKVIDKASERVVIDCRLYMGKSKSASTVYCSIWVFGQNSHGMGGYGTSNGFGYHKESAAIQLAIESAGITLYGSPYNRLEGFDINKKVSVAGCGTHEQALLAIAHACGYDDVILAR
jgi:hypothetical protein